MNHFNIEVVAADNTRYSCGSYSSTDPVLPGGSYTVTCNKHGRYVYVTKLQGYTDPNIITICEVKVYAFLTTTTKTTTTTTTPPVKPADATSKSTTFTTTTTTPATLTTATETTTTTRSTFTFAPTVDQTVLTGNLECVPTAGKLRCKIISQFNKIFRCP